MGYPPNASFHQGKIILYTGKCSPLINFGSICPRQQENSKQFLNNRIDLIECIFLTLGEFKTGRNRSAGGKGR